MNENTFAFPREITHLQKPLTAGMTLRDYFAAKAMQNMIYRLDDGISYEGIAEDAFVMADAMICAREKNA
jgi:hypothetical protein